MKLGRFWYVLLVLIFGTTACTTSDSFVVDGALIVPNDRKLGVESGELFHGHHVQIGRGLVFAFREYSPGSPFVVDDENFEKLSVWIPAHVNLPIEASISSVPEIIVNFTRGSSAFPRHACFERIKSGELHISRKADAYFVKIQAKLAGDAGSHSCEGRRISRTFLAKPIDLAALTPWLGKSGEHVYEETYR